MSRLFRLSDATEFDDTVEEWLFGEPERLYSLARFWFARMRECGDDVRELLHDGCPTACVQDAAFAYVNVFAAHVNIGFYNGMDLNDPEHLLAGSGKYMRHIKLIPEEQIDSRAIDTLIRDSYQGVKASLGH